MTPVEGKTFQNETVVIDGKFFHGCTFQDCTIVFLGGEYGLLECNMGVNVWQFKSGAHRTVQLMKALGLSLDQMGSDPTHS